MTAMTLDKALVPNTAGSFGKSYLKRDPLELYQLLKQKSSLKSEINKTAIKDSGSKDVTIVQNFLRILWLN